MVRRFLRECMCMSAYDELHAGITVDTRYPTGQLKKRSLQSTKPARSPFIFRFFGVCLLARINPKVERDGEIGGRWATEKIGKNGKHTHRSTYRTPTSKRGYVCSAEQTKSPERIFPKR